MPCVGTLYARTDTKSAKKTHCRYPPKRNVRDKTINKISDQWLDKWLQYMQQNSTDLPLEAFGIESTVTGFASFIISKPKPWRNDDEKYKKLNSNAEQAVDPNRPGLGPLPYVNTRSDSPALELISQKGCGVSSLGMARIVNGRDAQPGAYPWMVAILKGGDAWCGGAIINQNWIITAGHCFMSDINPRQYAIRVGSVDRNSGTTYKVDRVIIHERFHLDNMFNSDIALVHVNRPIKMGKLVKPVCLPKKAYQDLKTTKLLVVGWGQTSYEDRDLPTILQEVFLDIIKLTDCANKYKTKGNKIYFSQICTWNEDKDACQGDSGAPAIEYHSNVAYLVGIVSYGSTCADEMPGVYTKVSFYLDWILRTLEIEERLVTDSIQFYQSYNGRDDPYPYPVPYPRQRKPQRVSLQRRPKTANYYYIDDNPLYGSGRKRDLANYQSAKMEADIDARGKFTISKPKPWRKDDGVAIRANQANEVPANPNDSQLEMMGTRRSPRRTKASQSRQAGIRVG